MAKHGQAPRRARAGKRSAKPPVDLKRENAALKRELRERTDDLKESLEYQTATSDVLKVISRSAFDLQPVLETLVATTVRLCHADLASINLRDGEVYRVAASFDYSPEPNAYARNFPMRAGRETITGRTALERRVVHVADVVADPEYVGSGSVTLGKVHTGLGVPLLRDGEPVGVIALFRRRVEPFTKRQIELVRTFADQAAIAMENGRLLGELRESLERQTATSEVLQVINGSPGDLTPVFDALLDKALALCDAPDGIFWSFHGDQMRVEAARGLVSAAAEYFSVGRCYPIGATNSQARLIRGERFVHILDVSADDAYRAGDEFRRVTVEIIGVRTLLAVPLRKEGTCIGAFIIDRTEVRPFTDRQIAILEIFAAQAAIAMENARLLDELRERTTELSRSADELTATGDVLKIISRSSVDLESVLDTLVETAGRLCRADRAHIFRRRDDMYHLVATRGGSQEGTEFLRSHPFIPDRGTVTGRAALERRAVHIPDVLLDPEYTYREAQKLAGFRTMLGVPLLRGKTLLGILTLNRTRLDPYSTREIELATTFADQAVIAIENSRLFNEVQAKTRDLTESLQQQTATADVLKVISRSAFDLEAVLNTLVESAVTLSGARTGTIFQKRGDLFHLTAQYGYTPEMLEYGHAHPITPGIGSNVGRTAMTAAVVQIPDVIADPDFTSFGYQRVGNFRAMLGIPIMREGNVEGVFSLAKPEPGLFAARQVELVQTFADQAVIAIENARLFEEVQAKSRDLEESLEQQIATSEVLSVISSSTGDLAPVFDAMLGNAMQLCGANFGVLNTFDGAHFQTAATYGLHPAYDEFRRSQPLAYGPATAPARHLRGEPYVEIDDLQDSDAYRDGDPNRRALVDIGGALSLLAVPLLKDERVVGNVMIFRQEKRPFSEKQITLLQQFAAQAVIAIENTRLLRELRESTEDLSESLQQQTATADVLKVIGRSAFDLNQVFETVVESSVRLCAADRAIIYRFDGEVLRVEMVFNAPPQLKDWLEQNPIRPGQYSVAARAALEHRSVQVEDVRTDPEHTYGAKEIEAFRTVLGVPMLKGDDLLGVIVVYHNVVKPFTDKQILLVSTFAEQAAIAIENVRLFEEVQAKTRDLEQALTYQTGTGSILKVIASSPTDVEPVLDAIVESACALCEANDTVVRLKQGEALCLRAHDGPIPVDRTKRPISRNWTAGRSFIDQQPVHVHDMLSPEGDEFPEAQERARDQGHRTILSVPLLREGESIGTITLRRLELNPFSDEQIALLQTFADQAVIAIGNVRLFDEVQTRTKELAASLDELRTAQDRLVQTEKLASLGQLTAGIAHEIKNPLNFVNNFSALSVELIDELRQTLGGIPLDSKLRTEISEIADMLQSNLDKVVQHGKRADSIVKNMLLHSRQGSGEHRSIDINAIANEGLNLAYHGARAENPSFNVTVHRNFDPAVGAVDGYPQEITRVLLNLISNGFYAATKRKAEAGDGFEPTLTATTKNLGDKVEIRIRDNGAGIPTEIKEKIFNPFFTTKPPGEGTGLGLSMSHDIIVKQHGGIIDVDTAPGAFTEFRIVLPRVGASLIKSGEHI
jgi:two-component system, NtrC family, sensor kinase